MTFILCYLVPVSFQFSSLIFGFIRNKNNNKQYRLGNNYFGESQMASSQGDKVLSSHAEDQTDASIDIFASFGRERDKTMSDASGAIGGLNFDYFDPPLMDYM